MLAFGPGLFWLLQRVVVGSEHELCFPRYLSLYCKSKSNEISIVLSTVDSQYINAENSKLQFYTVGIVDLIKEIKSLNISYRL